LNDPHSVINRVRWIDHNKRRILLLDFSHAKVEESLALINDFCKVVDAEPDDSVYLLTDVTGADYDSSVAQQWKAARFVRTHKIRRSAVFGLSGLIEIAIRAFHQALALFGKKSDLKICGNLEESLRWLEEGD